MRKPLIAVLAATLCLIGVGAQAAPAAPTGPSAASPTADPLAAQLQAQLAQQQQLSDTVQSLSNDLQAARQSQQSLKQLIAANQQSIGQTVQQLSTAEQAYSDASSREAAEHAAAVAARNHERSDRQLLAMFVRYRYETSNSLLAFVLSSTSFSDLMSRAADVSLLTQRSTDLVGRIAAEAAAAEAAEAAAAVDADAAQRAALVLQAQQQSLEAQTLHARQLVDQLDAQAAATAAEINAANTQTLAVAQQIAQTRLSQLDDTIAQAEQAAWQAAEYYVQNHLGTLPASIAVPPSMPINPDGSQLVWPAHGVSITLPFGPTAYPFEPAYNGYPHFHTGIDLAGPLGTPIMAAAPGVVVSADATTVGYGNYIILASAGGILTLYGHLEAMLVKAGDTVAVGHVIGLLGSTGNSTGPHCHFEVRVNGQPVDPIPFLPPLAQGASSP